MTSAHQILVTGGTGKTGRRLIQRLQAAGIPVRVGSRSAALPFDWTLPATWQPVLTDIDAVYIAFQPDLAVPGAGETIQAFTDLAVRQGVRHLVLLSGRGEPEAQHCEEIVRQAGATWTVLRAGWFAQNFSESYLLDAVLAGIVALPMNTVQEPFVDADDLADVAFAALTDPRHAGQLYELTGPRLLTFAQATAEIAAATGRDIPYLPITIDEYTGAMAAQGLPAEVIHLIAYLFTTVLDGRNACLTDGVQRALGRAPKDFAVYARETAATGIWDAVPAAAPAAAGGEA